MKSIIAAYGGNPYQRLADMAKLAQKDHLASSSASSTGANEAANQA
jgi:hypothetical protein